MIRPLFSFYGSKHRIAPLYPRPMFGTIVEPFAGSAGYACRYPSRQVVLVERDPIVAGVWRYLLRASTSEIMALPLIEPGQDAATLPVCQEARWLIGFWLNLATSAPRRTLSKWALSGAGKNFWGPNIRQRIAASVDQIRHWRLIEGDWSDAPSIEATWFVDPPYAGAVHESKWTQDGPAVRAPAGDRYRFGAKRIDFAALGEWCASRRGQVIACDALGADWLPFRPFHDAKAARGRCAEVIWTNHPPEQPSLFDERHDPACDMDDDCSCPEAT